MCFNSSEILFASLISGFFLNYCKKHNRQNLRSVKFKYIHVFNTSAPVSGYKRNKMLSFGQAALNDLVGIWFDLPGSMSIRQVCFRSYLPSNKI